MIMMITSITKKIKIKKIKKNNMFLSLIAFFKYLGYPSNKKKFTIYSEGIFYKNYYYQLALKLNQTNELTIVTSDKKEFNSLKDNFAIFLIDNFLIKFFFFTFVNCKYLIMTMNDIGNNYNRSKFCEKYIYFFHSLASTHQIYNEKAYDNYDIIFINGKYQELEIRFREKLKKLKKKTIINSGYFFLKYLREVKKLPEIKNSILFAPSWNKSKRNFFNSMSEDIIQKLLNLNYSVILRPHPEIIKRNEQKFIFIKEKFSKYSKFQIDLSEDNIFLNRCEFILTDTSTIAIEFCLLKKKPPIYFNFEKKIHNPNYKDLPYESYENNFKNKFGINIENLNELDNLGPLIHNFLAKKDSFEIELIKFEKETLFNVDSSVDIAFKSLININ